MKRLSSLFGLILASGFVLFATSSFAAVAPDAPAVIAPVAVCADHVGIAEPMLFVESVDLTACDVQLLAATALCLVPVAMLVEPRATGAGAPVTVSMACSPGLRSPPT